MIDSRLATAPASGGAVDSIGRLAAIEGGAAAPTGAATSCPDATIGGCPFGDGRMLNAMAPPAAHARSAATAITVARGGALAAGFEAVKGALVAVAVGIT